MKKLFFPLFIFLFCWTVQAFSQVNDRTQYIDRYKRIAVEEMQRSGIPASIKLAQALLESGAGASDLAVYANNHFGIKCGPDWKGKKYFKEDDDYDEAGELIKSCFRVFKTAEASFIAHSEFLRDPKKNYRYGFLFLLDPTDYKKWAKGLRHSGYATNPNYDQLLIRIIENYELYRFDELSTLDVEIEEDLVTDDDQPFRDDQLSPEDRRRGYFENVFDINDTRMVFANGRESLTDLGFEYEVRVKKLLKFNEKITNSRTFLPSFTRVFLQKKRNNYRGNRKWHYVQNNETMFEISQLYGLKLQKLYKKNRMEEGKQPANSARIILRGKVKKDERPKYRSEAEAEAAKKKKLEEEKRKQEEEKRKQEEEQRRLEEEKRKLEEEKRKLEEEKRRLEEEKRRREEEAKKEAEEKKNDPPKEDKQEEKEVTPPKKEEKPKEVNPVYHVVKKGETLYRLKVMYGTPVEEIKKMNGLTSNLLSIGQRLRVK